MDFLQYKEVHSSFIGQVKNVLQNTKITFRSARLSTYLKQQFTKIKAVCNALVQCNAGMAEAWGQGDVRSPLPILAYQKALPGSAGLLLAHLDFQTFRHTCNVSMT